MSGGDFRGTFKVLIGFMHDGVPVRAGEVVEIHNQAAAVDLVSAKLAAPADATTSARMRAFAPMRTTPASTATSWSGR